MGVCRLGLINTFQILLWLNLLRAGEFTTLSFLLVHEVRRQNSSTQPQPEPKSNWPDRSNNTCAGV